MHPTDKKNILYISMMMVITLPVLIYSWLDSYLFVFVSFFLYGIHGAYTKNYWHSAILTCFFTIYIYSIFFLFKHVLFDGYWDKLAFFFSFVVAIVIPVTSYKRVMLFFIDVIKASRNEKNMYFAVKQFPDVVCKEHNLRTELVTSLGYREIKCRNGEKCTSKSKIVCAKNIVGTIGMNGNMDNDEQNYHIPVWDEVKETTNNADYDIIKIYENEEIANYDGAIASVVSFLYNEIDRYKPIKHVVIQIIGSPPISDSTKRLLEDRFLKVEYVDEK